MRDKSAGNAAVIDKWGTGPGHIGLARVKHVGPSRSARAKECVVIMNIGKKKLIEVALPLEVINKASAREKSIRHGHPSTLHLWWARRPLAAARAVIFAQMVDDPSSYPDLFPTEREQERERERLFKIIEELVQWENTNNEEVLRAARDKIWESWRRTCAENTDHPRAHELFTRDKLPAFHDPFAGGGSIPLEAQRLGLESFASDLNPVAVLINKAMIEIPPKFCDMPPVNPKSRANGALRVWRGAEGLAEDVRYYGQWMLHEAERRIGHLYPKVRVTEEMAQDRPDLQPYVGRELTVIAWLWARTVKSPNPAFAHVDVPLVSSFILSTKKGKEAYVEPVVEGDTYRFTVKVGKPADESLEKGTTVGKRGGFRCLLSGTAIPFQYVRKEALAGRMGVRLMAIVAEGDRERVYLPCTEDQEVVARKAEPIWRPDTPLEGKTRVNVSLYGFEQYGDLFTPRQLVALTTFADLVQEVRETVRRDAQLLPRQDTLDADAYADAIAVYLAFGVSRLANRMSTNCVWNKIGEKIEQVFTRQAIAMTWDFPEANPFSNSTGSWSGSLEWIPEVLEALPRGGVGTAIAANACTQSISVDKIISTDPPYYDNIAYADLADFFYVWLRRSLRPIFPDLFSTMAVPKSEELVATPYRHDSQDMADAFFLDGMTRALNRLAKQAHPAYPVTIYYAFKQSETKADSGTSSTGWETFLEAVIQAGFAITGTWPIRTERDFGMKSGMNVLASSIVLVCRKRSSDARTITRRQFLTALQTELPRALSYLRRSNIAPVDLAQAAIGPGMAVYTRYAKVVDAEGKPVSVREALSLINKVLDEALAEQEGDLDSDTRWAVAWFEQYGFTEGEYGEADTLSKAKNTSVTGLADAGIVESKRGKVRLLRPAELPADWDPTTDTRLTAWEIVHHLIRALENGGEEKAAELVRKLGTRAEIARDLAYRLYTVCERKKWASEALSYNSLVQSWPEIIRLAQEGDVLKSKQATIFERGGELRGGHN